MCVGMYPSLMGSFSCPTSILMIVSSFDQASTSTTSVSFCMTHMEDPWILPTPSTLSDPVETNVLLPAAMISYQANLKNVAEPSPSSYVLPAWAVQSSHAHDYLDMVFPLDEAIIEAMSGVEPPWEELHHSSYFLLELDHLECEYFRVVLSQIFGSPMVTLSSPGPMADGNMENIYSTIPINISCDPGRIENVYVGAECSHAEIQEYIELFKEFYDIFAWSYD